MLASTSECNLRRGILTFDTHLLTRHRVWLIGIGAGIGIGLYYIWRRSRMYSKSQISIFELAERRKALGIGVYNEKQYQEAIRIFNDIVRSLCPKSAESIIRAHSDLLAICENNIAAYYDNLVNKSSQPVLRAVSSDMQKYINEDGRRRVPIEDIARSVWNNRRALPVEKAGTLSVLSDDSFISACDEFVNLCEIPSSDKESISTDFATLALYNNGLKATESGDVKYRKSRAELCGCDSEQDFAAKLFGIRLAFRRLMDDPQTMQRLVQYGRIIMADLLRHDKRDPAEFYAAYDRMIAFINDENNLDTILNELKSRKVESTNLWDTLFDLIILDAFEDLQRPPSAISALVKNSFISKSMKESTLNNLIWSMIKVKRQRLQVKDGFISHFYDISQILTSSLAMGLFGGSNREYQELCIYLKEQIFGFILEIFNPNKVRFTKVEELACDIKKLLFERMELLQVKLLNELLPA